MHLAISFSLATLLAVPASAFWRLPCVSPLVQERADPIVNPGAVSGHLHTIMGGNAFDFTMDYATTQRSTCSSCTVQGDLSNYWTPVLFYEGSDGKFEKVDQIGGATVYYLQRNAQGENITAFPEGFRMLAGDPFKRTGGTDNPSQAVSYHCLDYNGPDRPETGAFPSSNCPNGVRSQIFFPSCWDGKNLDSADHKSHVAYPDGAYNAGTCPPDHPVRLISLFYEIIWDTNQFANRWYGNSQPFVWSMGDPTGYGFHGDFVNGWDVSLLQKAANQCTNLSGRVEDCPLFNLTPDSTANGCLKAGQVNDVITGTLSLLPGCNPVQSGPARATPASVCTASTAISQVNASSYYTDLTSSGWAYQGCAIDNYYNRSMTAASTTSNTMTNSACVQYCLSKGYSIAGTEYSSECYCGNTFPWDRMPVPGVVGDCDMTCSGDQSQKCGGSGLMSLYRKCTGSSCTNAQVGVVGGASSASSSVKSTAVSPVYATSSASSKTSSSTTTSSLKTSTSKTVSTTTKSTSTLTTTTKSSSTLTTTTTKQSSSSPSGTTSTTKKSSTSTTTTTSSSTSSSTTSTSSQSQSQSKSTFTSTKSSTSTSPSTSTSTPTSNACTPGPTTLSNRLCTVICNTDRPGGDYRSLSAPTWPACMQACASDPRCVTAQYHANIATCYLKNSKNAAVAANGEMTVDCGAVGTAKNGRRSGSPRVARSKIGVGSGSVHAHTHAHRNVHHGEKGEVVG